MRALLQVVDLAITIKIMYMEALYDSCTSHVRPRMRTSL